MLILVSWKDHNTGYIGIPIAQWAMNTDEGVFKRIYVIAPRLDGPDPFCEVDVAIEEAHNWLILASDGKELSINEIPLGESIDKVTSEDLYYVWDDGALSHLERAKRLYKIFENQIALHSKQALDIRNEAADTVYQTLLKEAKERGWQRDSVSRPEIIDAYGSIPKI